MILGFGSLLSEASARTTCPGLTRFRTAVVRGFRRVFNEVGVIFIVKGLASWDTREVASVNVERDPDSDLLVSVFEITDAEVPALKEREHRYSLEPVPFEATGTGETGEGLICIAHSDHHYRNHICVDEEEYHERVGRHYEGPLRREDILPCRAYLQHCMRAASRLGEACHTNFLQTSYLADQTTTIAAYLDSNPEASVEVISTFDRYRA